MTDRVSALERVSIGRLRTFCKVVEAGSIARAAPGDLNKQSQYSRQIREVEEAVGANLFRRNGKQFQITDAGRELAVLTQGYFKALGDLQATLEQTAEPLIIGAGESILRWWVFPVFSELQSSVSGAQLVFRTVRTREAVEQLKQGNLDLALLRKDAVEEPLSSFAAGQMDYALAVPRSLLPGKSAAGIKGIGELPMAMIDGDGAFVKGARLVAERNGLSIRVRVLAASFSLLMELIQQSDLAAFLPAVAARGLSEDRFAIIQLDGMESLSRKLELAFHPKMAEVRPIIRRLCSRAAGLLAGSQAK